MTTPTFSPVYPPELFITRRNRILDAYRRLTPEQQRNVIAELAEIAADPRSADEIDRDEWSADWRATNESNRPPQ